MNEGLEVGGGLYTPLHAAIGLTDERSNLLEGFAAGSLGDKGRVWKCITYLFTDTEPWLVYLY